MDDALIIHRLHFAFTITYHYLFPQLTMGLAPLIVVFKTLALWKREERYNRAARFWAKIFAVNFLFGVITAFAMHPYLLPATTQPSYGLTIYNSQAGAYSLTVGLVWWLAGVALAVGYFAFLYRSFRGKVSPVDVP